MPIDFPHVSGILTVGIQQDYSKTTDRPQAGKRIDMKRYTASQRRMYGAAKRAARARARASHAADPNYTRPRETKWYAIKRDTWMRFIAYLKTIQKPAHELTEEERALWDCYYIAKEHGKNENGLLELPWARWQRVNRFAE